MRLTPLPLVALALVAGCSSSSSGAAASAPAPTTAAAGEWADGFVLKGTVTIPAGTTVRLAHGAAVAADKGSKLLVAGTLLAPAGGSVGGTDWEGITVARGGSLALTGVTVSGSGITTEEGALAATLTGSTISKATNPFFVAKGTTLALNDVKIRHADGPSAVYGLLVADKLSYDKGNNPGLVATGAASALRVKNSEFYGDGNYDGDMITTSKAGEVTFANTSLHDLHCAFHLVGVAKLSLDHLSIHDNAYGFMAYGSDPSAVHRITATDVYDNRDHGLQETSGTEQGKVVIDGGYWARNGDGALGTISQITGRISRVNPASALVNP
jgi:hypothetical protein